MSREPSSRFTMASGPDGTLQKAWTSKPIASDPAATAPVACAPTGANLTNRRSSLVGNPLQSEECIVGLVPLFVEQAGCRNGANQPECRDRNT